MGDGYGARLGYGGLVVPLIEEMAFFVIGGADYFGRQLPVFPGDLAPSVARRYYLAVWVCADSDLHTDLAALPRRRRGGADGLVVDGG